MAVNIGKKLVVLLQRDFKNERLQKNPPNNNLLNLKPLVNNLLEEIKKEPDDVVEILPEDITDISSDDEFDSSFSEWEQDDCEVKLQKQGNIDINKTEFRSNRTNSGRKVNRNAKKHTKDESWGKTREDPSEDNSEDSDFVHEANFEDSDDDNKSDSSSNKQFKAKKKLKGSVMERMSKEEKQIVKASEFFSCMLCGFEVKTSWEKDAHKKFHNVKKLNFGKRYRCSKCSKVISEKLLYFKMHWQKHAGKQIFSNILHQCPHCPYKFGIKGMLKNHLLAHTRKGKYQCEFCSYSHDHQKDVTKHMFLHNKFPSGIYSCEECSFTTKSQTSFCRHKKLMHVSRKIWFNCPHCPFKTVYKDNLSRHVMQHNQGIRIKCPQCTHVAATRKRAREHLKLHNDKKGVSKSSKPEQGIQCPHCSYKASCYSNLQYHFGTHGIAPKLYCADCPFSCHYKGHMKGHVIWHKRDGRYKCPWCSFSNDTSSSITKHKFLHQDDREAKSKNEFYCANCPHKSKQKDCYFIKHVQGHLKKDGLKCDYCTFRHDLPRNMRIHMKLHTDGK